MIGAQPAVQLLGADGLGAEPLLLLDDVRLGGGQAQAPPHQHERRLAVLGQVPHQAPGEGDPPVVVDAVRPGQQAAAAQRLDHVWREDALGDDRVRLAQPQLLRADRRRCRDVVDRCDQFTGPAQLLQGVDGVVAPPGPHVVPVRDAQGGTRQGRVVAVLVVVVQSHDGPTVFARQMCRPARFAGAARSADDQHTSAWDAQNPLGCQTVLVSRNARTRVRSGTADQSGSTASAPSPAGRTTRLTVSAAAASSSPHGTSVAPARSRPLTSRCDASHGASSAVRPVTMLTTPPGTSDVASTSASETAGNGRCSLATTTTVLPETIAGAITDTRPS